MNVLDSYIREGLEALDKAEVEYLVCGGYAVNFHGYRRTTGNIDIWLAPDNDNKAKVIAALRSLKTDSRSMKALQGMDFKQQLLFTDGEEPYKMNFMTRLQDLSFDKAWNKRVVSGLDKIDIPFLGLHDLLASKQGSKLPKDRMDVEQLEKISRIKNG